VIIHITDEQILDLTEWFDSYTSEILEAQQGDEHILLKIEHTKRVCDEIGMLGRSIDLDQDALKLAYIIALFHDIGRFDQIATYKTFVDKDSVDHAQHGAALLTGLSLFDSFSDTVRSTILTAIEQHNKAYLPDIPEETLLYAKLIRDADKLDIYKVVTDYYQRSEPNENRVIQLGLPDTDGVSPAVAGALLEQKIVLSEHLQNLNDFKLLQAAWIFDCNFPATYKEIKKRGYLEILKNQLPETEQITTLFQDLHAYLTGVDLIAPT
jgi:HD superfamily phosphohydrolase YqeK